MPSQDVVDQLVNKKSLEIDTNSKKHRLIFDWEHNDRGFLINDISADEYKPFISLCSKAIYYFSNVESKFVDEFFREKKEAIAKLEDEFIVPLTKNPHLVNTFAIYTPTRIETFLLNIRDNKNHITGVTFCINDTFGNHQDCEVSFLLSSEGGKETEEGSFKLSDEPKNISTEFNPDYMEVIIKDGEEIIFEERCHFVKSVSINMNVVSGSIKTSSGTVSTHSSSSFTIGGDSE